MTGISPENTNTEPNQHSSEHRTRRRVLGAAGIGLTAIGIGAGVYLSGGSGAEKNAPQTSPDATLESAGPNMYVGREIPNGEKLPCFEGTAIIQQKAMGQPNLHREFAVFNPPITKKDGHLLVAIGTDHKTATPQHVKFEYVDVMGDNPGSLQTRFALLPGGEATKIIPCTFRGLRTTKDYNDQINLVPSTNDESISADLTTATGRAKAGVFALPLDPSRVHGDFTKGPQVAQTLLQELNS